MAERDDLDQRQPRVRNSEHMGWVARQPCIACLACDGIFAKPVEVAHLRASSLEHGKRATGMAEKPSDLWTTPLCADHHRLGANAQHGGGELDWWAHTVGVDPFELCLALVKARAAGRDGALVIAHFAAMAQKARMG